MLLSRREAEAAERRRREAEAAERRRKAEYFENYLEVTCPKCNTELAFMPWQADEYGNVVCPECECTFRINIEVDDSDVF